MAVLDLPSAEVTAALLRSAFATALGPLPAVAPLDLPRYVRTLCRCYHSTHATPPNLETAARGLTALGDHRAAAFVQRQARDEIGHDMLVLKDLKSLGLPSAIVGEIFPANARKLVALHERLASDPKPYGVFGYAYALETFAALLTSEDLAEIQRLVPPGVDITRCLRVHAVNDGWHVANLVERITACGQREREAVISAIQETVPLIVEGLSDEGMAEVTDYLARIAWAAPGALETVP